MSGAVLLSNGLPGWYRHGECRLNYVSASAVRLDPYHGNQLIVDQLARVIPDAGVTLTNAGLSGDTTYYVYAYMDGDSAIAGPVIRLLPSTTGYVTQNGIGVVTKSDAPGPGTHRASGRAPGAGRPSRRARLAQPVRGVDSGKGS